jgi:hypothetical protein
MDSYRRPLIESAIFRDADGAVIEYGDTPDDPAAAPLTFVFTSFPSVIVHAGLLHDLLYPVCGCDACDETWEHAADRMEWQTQAVVKGNYRESAGEYGVGFRLGDDNGSVGGSARSQDFPRARLDAAARTLSKIDGWNAWPSA